VGTAAGGGYLTGNGGGVSDANANDNAFGIFVLAAVRFTVR
jgi:hypothetical protein